MSRPTLIGITGHKGHGKDTVGAMLVARGFTRVTFAEPLKEMLRVGLGLTVQQTDGPIEVKEAIDPRYGCTPRHLMQTLGTEWGRVHVGEDVWVNAALARCPVGADVVITDCRFPNEADAIRARGGVVVRVVRPGVAGGVGAEHPSEAGVDHVGFDFLLANGGTLDDLAARVDQLLAVVAGTLRWCAPST